MKRHIIVFFAIIYMALPSVGHALEGLPGSTWGDLHWEIPANGNSDLVLEGWIRQGVAWKKWERGDATFQLNTYLTARYKWDSEALDWNNYIGPGAGVAIEMYRPHGPVVSLGAEHIYQMNYRSSDQEPKTALFLNWFHWWNIGNKSYPGSAWGDLRWEIPNTGKTNIILDGWIRQGITWKKWENGRNSFLLNPYLKIRYKFDSEGLDWNNYIGPGVGIALDMESQKGPLVTWGTEYSWEKNLQSGSDAHRVDLYMRWYVWWDLMKKEPAQ